MATKFQYICRSCFRRNSEDCLYLCSSQWTSSDGSRRTNAYLTAPTSEKFHIICGPEFGSENIGKKTIVKGALYDTKSAGRDFRNHLRDCMTHMGYTSCKADLDLWIRKAKHTDDRDYYEYMLLYVDDCLCVSEDPEAALNQLNKYFPLEPGSVGTPKLYLGEKITQVTLPNGMIA